MTRVADHVFDLDGTLSDPFVGISRSLNFALGSHGLAEVPDEAIGKLVGPPLDLAFRQLVPGCDDDLVVSLVGKYRERYAQIGYAENEMYDGIPEALSTLERTGAILGVCTSKRADFAERILERFRIRQHFAFVDGGDVGIAKSHQLAGLLANGQIDPGSTMIGDRAVDIEAAKINGLAAVGVLWGYGSRAELETAGADALLSHTDELAHLAGASSG